MISLIQGRTPAQQELRRLQKLLSSDVGIAHIGTYISKEQWTFPSGLRRLRSREERGLRALLREMADLAA